MEFLSPGMLLFAATAAVPVVLHLIMRQTPQRVVFPAVRFIRRRSDANRRRMKLRHLLLLLLRVAALVLLAVALARPSLRSGSLGLRTEAPVSAVMLVDTSLRMEYLHQSRTRVQQAQETALWLLEQLPRNSEVAVLDGTPGGGGFQVDLPAAAKRLRALKPSAVAVPLAERVAEALSLLEKGEHPYRELYVFTDLARWSWPRQAQGRLQAARAAVSGLQIYLIDVSAPQAENTSLQVVQLSRSTVAENTPVEVQVELVQEGSREVNKVVHLRLADVTGKEVQAMQQTVTVPGQGSQPIRFVLGALPEGVYQGRLRLVGQDALPADDQRYFTLRVHRAWPVLIAAPEPAQQRAVYFREAIAPEQFRLEKRARYQTQVISLDELSGQELSRYRVVVLLDPFPLSDKLWNRLAGYVEQGGRLVVFLGRHARPQQAMNTPAALRVLPGALLEAGRAPDGSVFLAPRDYQHPALRLLQPLRDQLAWDAFPVYRYWLLDSLAQDAQPVIAYSNGEPALLERRLGQGVVMVMTTPVSDPPGRRTWNTLATGLEPVPFFLLVNGIMDHLSMGQEERLNWTISPGLAVTVRLPRQEPVRAYRLTYPSGLQEIRRARGTAGQVVVSALEEVGNYQVRAGSNPPMDTGFSVNLAPEVTQLRRVEPETLQALLGEQFHLVRTREELRRQVRLQQVGRELYAPLVLLLVLILVGEWLLSNLFYGLRQSGQVQSPRWSWRGWWPGAPSSKAAADA